MYRDISLKPALVQVGNGCCGTATRGDEVGRKRGVLAIWHRIFHIATYYGDNGSILRRSIIKLSAARTTRHWEDDAPYRDVADGHARQSAPPRCLSEYAGPPGATARAGHGSSRIA